MQYLRASAVVIHYEEALYQVYAPLPFPLFQKLMDKQKCCQLLLLQQSSLQVAHKAYRVKSQYNVSRNNVPTLASCGRILIIFGNQHQHTLKSDVPIQISLSFHFYLLYLLLNSATEMT